MTRKSLSGVFPIAPTPFQPSGDLDIKGKQRVIDCMIDQGVDGICILANYSEQFALTDKEREQLLDVCMRHNNGRVPMIVTCSHYSTRIAVQRAQAAAAAGAAMVMIMPPYHGTALRADDSGVYEHFAAIADAINIPIMVQDAPLSGVSLSVPLLTRMAKEIPRLGYFKIEMPGTADKLRSLIKCAGSTIEGPFDGEESITLLADLDAGATGTMPSALIPDLIKPVVKNYLGGHRDLAIASYNKILPIINFENRQCNLRATKAAMMAGGVIGSDTVRHPFQPLPEHTRRGLLELLSGFDPVVLRWGK